MPATDRGGAAPPAWVWLSSSLLSLGGIGVSIYLTISHYDTKVSLACPEGSVINCQKVTTSAESVIAGIPVAVLGLVYFVGMLAVSLPWAWRVSWRPLAALRVLAAAVGVGMVAWLVYVELFRLDAICLWCTVVHVLTVLLFAVIVLATALLPAGDPVELA